MPALKISNRKPQKLFDKAASSFHPLTTIVQISLIPGFALQRSLSIGTLRHCLRLRFIEGKPCNSRPHPAKRHTFITDNIGFWI